MPETARARAVKLLAEVAAIHRELDAQPIERQCRRTTECCQFQLTRRVPQVTRGEARLAVRAWRASGRKHLPEPAIAGACPFLRVDGVCQIYAQRPFGCRTHFCAPAGGPIARREVLPLIRRLEEIDHQMNGEGPRPFPAALAREWRADL